MKRSIRVLIAAWIALSSAGRADESLIREIPLEKIQTALNQVGPEHPRLFVDDRQLPELLKRIEANPELKVLHEQIIKQADSLLAKHALKRVMTGRRLLSVSREAIKRLSMLSWAYRTTGNRVYLERAEQEMLAIAAFDDWNPDHFLDVAEMTTAMAIGYDWLYNDLSDQSRNAVRQAIVEKGLKPSFGKHWWINTNNNWNQVCHGGLTCGALAVLENEPKLAETIIHRAVNKVQLAMAQYEPDGAYPEGPGYWVYGTTFNVILLAALDSVMGTDFGLSEKNGFSKCPEYLLHVTGPTGLFFNYPDSGTQQGFTPAVFWFAKKYNTPSLSWTQREIWQNAIQQNPSKLTRDRDSVFALLWATPEIVKPKTLSWMGRGLNPVAMFRTAWDADATYLAIKGGSPNTNHAHMDAGSFVIDAAGLRWAADLGPENYNKIETLGMGLWNGRQDGDRWKLFRYNNYAHNTLTVNDQLQQVSGMAPMIRYSGDSSFPHVAFDLTSVYKGQLAKALRGGSLLPNGHILIRDELQAADKAATVRWAMVTPANVEIQSEKSATLTQKNKTTSFRVITDKNIRLTTYSTEPKADYDEPNPGTRMIGFELKLQANETADVIVIMTPPGQQETSDIPDKHIKDWSKPLDE